MRISLTKLYCPAVVLVFAGFTHGLALAQTFTTLHSFTAAPNGTNADGANPNGGLVLAGNTLYGTAVVGGNARNGTVFSLKTDGTAFKVLHSFTTVSGHFPGSNNDGANPMDALLLSGSTLYGATFAGGASGVGTVYKLNIDGSGFNPLHTFAYPLVPTADGCFPDALLLAGDTLYGMTDGGGFNDNGTLFQMSTDGSGFVTVFGFCFAQNWHWPYHNLVLSGDTFYGTSGGGGYDMTNGLVFAVNKDGSGFATLHLFTGGDDGTRPAGSLLLSGSTLYGVSVGAMGTLFRVGTDGSDFTVLHRFMGGNDGAAPEGLFLSGNTLYGTTWSGGSSDCGTVYSVNTDGTGYKTLYSFTGGLDGAHPRDGLIVSGSILYGTAWAGGSSTNGTVFSISLSAGAPRPTLVASGPNLVLTWPATASGLTLQSTASLGPAADWQTFSPETPRVVVDGQYSVTVTNGFTGSQRYFRLSQ
jgi:uncharacterized repeat protein (TIGR03803 family)